MIRQHAAGPRHARLTFVVSSDHPGEPVGVAGDFNDWRWELNPFKNCGDSLEAEVTVEVGHRYRFRYRTRDDGWFNDDHADDYVPNEYGGVDCVVDVADPA